MKRKTYLFSSNMAKSNNNKNPHNQENFSSTKQYLYVYFNADERRRFEPIPQTPQHSHKHTQKTVVEMHIISSAACHPHYIT